MLLLGAYFLAFFLTKDRFAGVLAAAAYGLTTYMTFILIAGHNSRFITLCFAPWLVLAFVSALRRPGLFVPPCFFAIALGINLRGGHVQMTYYVAFLLGVWWVVEAVYAGMRKDWKPFGVATVWLALGGVLGLLLVAQPYLLHFRVQDLYHPGGRGCGAFRSGLGLCHGLEPGQGGTGYAACGRCIRGRQSDLLGAEAVYVRAALCGARSCCLLAVFAVRQWRNRGVLVLSLMAFVRHAVLAGVAFCVAESLHVRAFPPVQCLSRA